MDTEDKDLKVHVSISGDTVYVLTSSSGATKLVSELPIFDGHPLQPAGYGFWTRPWPGLDFATLDGAVHEALIEAGYVIHEIDFAHACQLNDPGLGLIEQLYV